MAVPLALTFECDGLLSLFVSYFVRMSSFLNNNSPPPVKKQQMPGVLNRTTKVAKTRYNDHGDHHPHKTPSRNGNILKNMTMNATELFRLWQSEAAAAASKSRKKRASPRQETHKQQQQQQTETESPHRFAFSQLALDGSTGQPQQHPSASASAAASSSSSSSTTQQQSEQGQFSDYLGGSESKISNNHGSLAAVIENTSQASSLSRKTGDNGSIRSKGSVTSRESSIATKSSIATQNSLRTLPPGKCLTQPSEPTANDGQDNAEGNLIVRENDSISVTRKQIHVLTRDKMRNATRADFRIISLLGQGTFAQVFQCLHVQTGNHVAVKIVKNKPAYTRQAAVEIDVFRALTKKPEKVSSSQSQKGLSISPTNSVADSSVASQTAGGTKWDYMVDLVCYFMHKSHLCLVFELLTLNLYEVLKKRQFRGLPLPIVQTFVRQAVGGIKELAKKNIVHCDLKPENILLVNEDDTDSVVSAGERSKSNNNNNKKQTSSKVDNNDNEHGGINNKVDALTADSDNVSGTQEKVKKNGLVGTDKIVSQSPTKNSITTNGTATNHNHNHHENNINHHHQHHPNDYLPSLRIKLIDFGSACFEGQTAHTYIQSRFYRSPEVLIGLPYDSAIDMWSLGCVAAELFLGLPILPGVHEHDQLNRICEMISTLPDWMVDQGSKASKYFIKYIPRSTTTSGNPVHADEKNSKAGSMQQQSNNVNGIMPTPPPPPTSTTNHQQQEQPQSSSSSSSTNANTTSTSRRFVVPSTKKWRIRTQQEYISTLSQNEIRKKGGLQKLEKQPMNRYFKRKKLSDIILHKGQSSSSGTATSSGNTSGGTNNTTPEEKELLELFIHFLYGMFLLYLYFTLLN